MLVNGEAVENYNVKRTLVNFNKKERSLNVNVTACKKARYLADKFKKLGYDDADNCYSFFVKCFRNMAENTVWDIFENATNNPKINSGIKYFIAACRNQMS